MLAGLTAGAVAAIIAALVSLPLHSPVDSAFNSATVAVGCLVLGLISGLLWNRWGERPLVINGILVVLFVIVLVVAFVGNSLLDRFLSFVLPLAAIAFVICAMLTPLLSSYFRRPGLGWKSWGPASVAIIAALVVGFALITQGDAESGELSLPPAPTAIPRTTIAASGHRSVDGHSGEYRHPAPPACDGSAGPDCGGGRYAYACACGANGNGGGRNPSARRDDGDFCHRRRFPDYLHRGRRAWSIPAAFRRGY